MSAPNEIEMVFSCLPGEANHANDELVEQCAAWLGGDSPGGDTDRQRVCLALVVATNARMERVIAERRGVIASGVLLSGIDPEEWITAMRSLIDVAEMFMESDE